MVHGQAAAEQLADVDLQSQILRDFFKRSARDAAFGALCFTQLEKGVHLVHPFAESAKNFHKSVRRLSSSSSFLLLTNDRGESTQGGVHRPCVRKDFGDVAIQDNNVASFRIAARVLAADPKVEIVFRAHLLFVVVTSCHRSVARACSPAGR